MSTKLVNTEEKLILWHVAYVIIAVLSVEQVHLHLTYHSNDLYKMERHILVGAVQVLKSLYWAVWLLVV